jgi:hypothetical protein
MNTAGQPLFRKAFDLKASQVDPSLTAGLITAVYHYSQTVRGESIQIMELMGTKLCFEESEGALFVATVERRLPDKDALDIVYAIRDAWLNKYKQAHMEVLDTKYFDGFEPVADQIVNDNLWWLKQGEKASFSNQVKYLKEVLTRPSRAVGSEFLKKGYFTLPIILFSLSILASHFLGAQLVATIIEPIGYSNYQFILTMGINFALLWFVLPLLNSAINGKMDKYRSTVLTTGYLFFFMLLLMVVTSRIYLALVAFGPYYTVGDLEAIYYMDPFNPTVGDYYNWYAWVVFAGVNEIRRWVLWLGPANVLFFYWLFAYAYIVYNIQRPEPTRHLLATFVSIIIVWTLQTMVYPLIIGVSPTTGFPGIPFWLLL